MQGTRAPHQARAQGGTFPARHEQLCEALRVRVALQLAASNGELQALGETLLDLSEAFLDFATENVAYPGEFLPQSAHQAAEITLGAVFLLAQLEEAAYPA